MLDIDIINKTYDSYRRIIDVKPCLYKINLIYDNKNINPSVIVKNYFEFIGLCVEENKREYDDRTILYFIVEFETLNLSYYMGDYYGFNYLYMDSNRINDLKNFLIIITERFIKEFKNRSAYMYYSEDSTFWIATKSDLFNEDLLFVAKSYAENGLAEIPLYNISKSDLCMEAFKRYQNFLNDIINYDNKSDFIKYIILKTKCNINKFRKKGNYQLKFLPQNLVTEIYELNIKNRGDFGLQWLLGESLLFEKDNWDDAINLFGEIYDKFFYTKAKLVVGGLLTLEWFERYDSAKRIFDSYCSSIPNDYIGLYFLGLANYHLGKKRDNWVDGAMNSMVEKFNNNLLSPSEYKLLYTMIKQQSLINGGGDPDNEYEYSWRYELVEESDAIDSYVDAIIDEKEDKEKVKKLIKNETKKYLKTGFDDFEKISYLFE